MLTEEATRNVSLRMRRYFKDYRDQYIHREHAGFGNFVIGSGMVDGSVLPNDVARIRALSYAELVVLSRGRTYDVSSNVCSCF